MLNTIMMRFLNFESRVQGKKVVAIMEVWLFKWTGRIFGRNQCPYDTCDGETARGSLL